jgi:FolB domain-containing protein
MNYRNDEYLDKIVIKDLLLRCVIGINEWERKEKQDVMINIVIWCDLKEAARTDDIKRTVNYKDVNKEIIELVEKSSFLLIETLAEKIAQTCLKHDNVRRVSVSVEKPYALRFARTVGVEINRKKGPVTV